MVIFVPPPPLAISSSVGGLRALDSGSDPSLHIQRLGQLLIDWLVHPFFLSPDSDVLDAKLCYSYVCIVSNMDLNNS